MKQKKSNSFVLVGDIAFHHSAFYWGEKIFLNINIGKLDFLEFVSLFPDFRESFLDIILNSKTFNSYSNNNKFFFEYTYVPRFKSSHILNRNIGMMLSVLSDYVDEIFEVSMMKLYSFFKIPRTKDSKQELRTKILKQMKKTAFKVYELNINKKKKKCILEQEEKTITPELLIQDCIDAYALWLYAKDFVKRRSDAKR